MRRKKLVRQSRELRSVLRDLGDKNAFINAIKGIRNPTHLLQTLKSLPEATVVCEYLDTDLDTLEIYKVYHRGELVYKFVR